MPDPTLTFMPFSNLTINDTAGFGVGRRVRHEPTATPAVTITPSVTWVSVHDTTGQLQIDGKDAVLMVISDTAIDTLLSDPGMTALLDEDATITYAARPSIKTGTTPSNITVNGSVRGAEYLPLDASGSSGDTRIYIDNHAAVVLGYEIAANDGTANIEFTMLGEPLPRIPTTLASFSGTYSGYFAMARSIFGSAILADDATFTMEVNFGTSESEIRSFSANIATGLGSVGSVTATNIPISNETGSFDSTNGGTVTFGAGTTRANVVSSSDAGERGHFVGQFHGSATAPGVTGAFHNGTVDENGMVTQAPTVLGGFAGSKE